MRSRNFGDWYRRLLSVRTRPDQGRYLGSTRSDKPRAGEDTRGEMPLGERPLPPNGQAVSSSKAAVSSSYAEATEARQGLGTERTERSEAIETLERHVAELEARIASQDAEAAHQIDELNSHLETQRAKLAEANRATVNARDELTKQALISTERAERLRSQIEAQRAKVALANERNALLKEQIKERHLATSAQIEKLKTRVQEQRDRVVLANERTGAVKETLRERTQLLQEKIRTSREKLILKSGLYDAARRYYAVYRQGLLFDEAQKSNVDFAADAYLCLLPSSVPTGLSLSRISGGRVYCDCVENVEVHKHSLAPRVHRPALEMLNISAFGALMSVDGIMTVGNALAKTVQKFGPPVHVAPNFRSFEEPAPANELRAACNLDSEDRLLFASGNVVVGFEPVLRALAKLPLNVHLAAVVKLKPAEYEKEMLALIEELGLSERVHFFDFVPYDKLASLAADADIGLITSDISNPNGAVALPNRLFDYLTAGLPVIAPPMPDVVDIIRTHGFGKTLGSVNTEEWVSAIVDVLDDLDHYRDAAVKARRELTWENGDDALLEFLGNPRTVTLIGFRDLSRYQRFIRVTRTLTSRGVKVKALFLSDDPAPVDISNADFYHFTDRYGLGEGPVRVPTSKELDHVSE